MIFFIFIFLLGGFLTEVMSVTGVVGGRITVKCSHAFAFSNIKYFCKAQCRDEDVLISTGKDSSYSKRYSIRDEGNTFAVTIADLRKDDTGTYWCAVSRTGWDTYKRVHLTVTGGHINEPDDEMPQSDSSEPLLSSASSSAVKLAYIGAGLAVVVLALALVFLTYFRVKRKKNTNTSSEKDHNVVYATPFRQDAHRDVITSSSTENQEAENRTDRVAHHRDTSTDVTSTFYSNATAPPEPQSDRLVYSTVTFEKDTKYSVATGHTDSVMYSTIKV